MSLKKLFSTMAVVAIAISTISAQGVKQSDKGNFSDNLLFVGVAGGVNMYQGEDDQYLSFGKRLAPSFQGYVGKWFTPSIGARVGYYGVNSTGLTFDPKNGYRYGEAFKDGTYKQKMSLSQLRADAMWNVFNTFLGYNSSRFWKPSPYIGAGVAWNKAKETEVGMEAKKKTSFAATVGLYNAFRVCEGLDITLDINQTFVNQHFDGESVKTSTPDALASISLGVAYQFKHRSVQHTKVVKEKAPKAVKASKAKPVTKAPKAKPVTKAPKVKAPKKAKPVKTAPKDAKKKNTTVVAAAPVKVEKAKKVRAKDVSNKALLDTIYAHHAQLQKNIDAVLDTVHYQNMAIQRGLNEVADRLDKGLNAVADRLDRGLRGGENGGVAAAPVAVFFPFSSATLDDTQMLNLTMYVDNILSADPNHVFYLTGSADKATGSEQNNYKLSEARVQAVCDILVKEFGVEKEKIVKRVIGGTSKYSLAKEPNRCVVIK